MSAAGRGGGGGGGGGGHKRPAAIATPHPYGSKLPPLTSTAASKPVAAATKVAAAVVAVTTTASQPAVSTPEVAYAPVPDGAFAAVRNPVRGGIAWYPARVVMKRAYGHNLYQLSVERPSGADLETLTIDGHSVRWSSPREYEVLCGPARKVQAEERARLAKEAEERKAATEAAELSKSEKYRNTAAEAKRLIAAGTISADFSCALNYARLRLDAVEGDYETYNYGSQTSSFVLSACGEWAMHHSSTNDSRRSSDYYYIYHLPSYEPELRGAGHTAVESCGYSESDSQPAGSGAGEGHMSLSTNKDGRAIACISRGGKTKLLTYPLDALKRVGVTLDHYFVEVLKAIILTYL